MVARSWAAARDDSRSSSASARAARSSAAVRLARLARVSTPATPAVRKMNACVIASYGSLWPGASSATDIPAATKPVTIQRQTGPHRSMTV